jgi:hypothetical protein
MWSEFRVTVICLHLSALAYAGLALLSVMFFDTPIGCLLFGGLAVLTEMIARRLDPKCDKLRLAVACLHISALAYALLALLIILLDVWEDWEFAVLGGLIIVVELVAISLQRRKVWAWFVACGFCHLYIPSLFSPLGILGLWALEDSDVKEAFGVS